MAVEADRFVHLSRPLAPSAVGFNVSNTPVVVNIQPQAVISILDHAVRRDINDTQSTRVIGALVGIRSEDGSEVEVRSCFAIPHTENEDQVEVDVEYQKNMLALALRGTGSGMTSAGAAAAAATAASAAGSQGGGGREALLGWYTTSLELNSFSALIQNFFASPETGTHPHPAVHLTLSTEPGAPVRISAYISSPVGVNAERAAESCMFVAVPHRLLAASDADRAALEAVAAAAADPEARSAPLASDVEGLARALETTADLLDRTAEFVGAVLDEDREPNQALGQYLMNALSLAPKVDPAAIEQDFSNHVQDVLMVSYLANTIRTQIDLAQRLATSTLTMGDKDEKKDGEGGGGGDKGERGGGQRGGRRGGRGGGGRGGGQQREPREPRDNGE